MNDSVAVEPGRSSPKTTPAEQHSGSVTETPSAGVYAHSHSYDADTAVTVTSISKTTEKKQRSNQHSAIPQHPHQRGKQVPSGGRKGAREADPHSAVPYGDKDSSAVDSRGVVISCPVPEHGLDLDVLGTCTLCSIFSFLPLFAHYFHNCVS